MKIKKMTALLLSGALTAAVVLSGCGSKEVDPEAVVATLNGKEIKLGLANFMAQYQAVTYDAYYSSYMGGASMWSQDYSGDGTTMEDMVKEQVMDSIKTDYLLEEHMADYGVEITDEELGAMKETAAKFMEDNKQPAIERMTATEEIVTEMLRLNTIQQKMHEAIIAEVDTEVSDEEAAQRTFSYYNVTLPEEDAAETQSLDATETVEAESSEEQAAELKAYAEQVAAAAEVDFDAVADTYGLTASTYSYGTDEEAFDKNVIAEADGLKEGQISGVIETESGQYYVIRLDKEFDEDATESKKQEIISTRQSDHYTEVCDGYEEAADWELNEKVWKTVTFTGNQYTIASSAAESEAATETLSDMETEAATETLSDMETEAVTETATESVQ